MKVVCCLARVPDTATRLLIAADGKSPNLDAAQWIINPYDEFALEEAIKLREARGTELLVLHAGPIDFQKDLRQCLAKGADRALQLTTSGPLGPLGLAKLMADKIRPLLPAVVFCGKQSVDGDVGATGTMLAHFLGIPAVTKISSLKIDGDRFVATREIEGGVETIEGSLPVVFTTEKGLNEPRRAGLKEIMAAKKKPLDVEAVAVSAALLNIEKLSLPPDRPAGKIVGEGVGAVPALVQLLKNEAKVI